MKKGYQIGVIVVCLLGILSFFGCKGPFIVDGPDMERDVWSAFTISQTSDVYEQNFAYTVQYDDVSGNVTLSTDVFDYEKGYPVEKSVLLKAKTASALFAYDLLSFPDEPPSEAEILDGTFLSVSVRGKTGLYIKKDVSQEVIEDILELLTPYIKQLEK